MTKPRISPQPPKQRTRGASRYKRGETTRLLQGALGAGLPVRGLEVDPVTGALRVLFGQPDAPDARSSPPSLEGGDAK
jgi:hypothetical protein